MIVSTQPQQVAAAVIASEEVAPRHFLMTLHAPHVASAAQAGQFVHVLPTKIGSYDPLLRRAFSIMATRVDSGEIDILFRAQGKGTSQIAVKTAGQTLDLIGPLGQAFDLRLFHVKQSELNQIPILVGGGIGVPPLIFLGATFRAANLAPLMLLGARSAGEILGLPQLGAFDIETRIATDDGSAGYAGRVTDLLEIALQNSVRAVIYACGPTPMLRAVAGVAARFNVPCQVSLEENMPCGIGVCNGCVVAMKEGSGRGVDAEGALDYGRYQRVCVSGPALWADRVDWEVT